MECRDNCEEHHAALLRGLDEGTIELPSAAMFCRDCQNHLKAIKRIFSL